MTERLQFDTRAGKDIPFSPAKAARGLKFSEAIRLAKYKEDQKTIDHLNSQPSVVSDVEYYKNSLKKEKSKPKLIKEVLVETETKEKE